MEYTKGMVLEAKHLRRNGSATHAVIDKVGEVEVHLHSVRIVGDKPQFFPGAQTRWIPKTSIPNRYKPTDIVMQV